MEDPMPVTRSVSVPLAEVDIRVSRSSGPGGQHANVTASRVEATFEVEQSRALSDVQKRRVIAAAGPRLTAIAQDTRSQARNRELALERLRDRLAAALRVPRKRRPTRRPRAADERRLQEKRQVSERKRRRRPPGPEH
jgi:ribosome-associated protein